MEIITLDDFKYYEINENEDGIEIELSKYIGNKKDIEIPTVFEKDGKKYYPIFLKDGCFTGNQHVRNVKLNEGITLIDEQCFRNSSLKEINIPNSVEVIGEYAFSNTLIEKIDFNQTKALGIGVCEDCSYLQHAILSNMQDYLESNFFKNCISLDTLFIPKNIIHIESSALENIKLIHNLQIEGEYFYLKDNASLINKDRKSLVYVFNNLHNKTYEVPDEVESIQSGAICGIDVETIIINNKIETLEYKSIFKCPNLINVDLHNIQFVCPSAILNHVENFFVNKNINAKYLINEFNKYCNIIFNGTKKELNDNGIVNFFPEVDYYYYKDIDELMQQGYDLDEINQIYRGYDEDINLSICKECLDISLLRKLNTEIFRKYYYTWVHYMIKDYYAEDIYMKLNNEKEER